MVDGVLYGLTPSQKVFALNAATGKLLWKFDSGIKGTQPDRGLAYWTDDKERRILVAVMNFVYALDAATGKPISSFGKDGRIDLREDLGRDPAAQSIYVTSPAVIYKDLMIVGGRESETLPASPGDVRAYDVRTGKLRWSFHTIPHPGEFGYDTWPKDAWKTSGAANNWAGMTVDTQRGIVYVPTGSAAFDFYGADRVGDDLFANCLIALNAETGERIWHFQAVKHDLWDRDFPAPPVLLTVERDGKKVDAVAQTTKQGFVFLFDRTNGKPLFPIECRKYPAERRARRSGRATAMPAREAGAVCAPVADRESAQRTHAGSASVGAGKIPQLSQRRSVRSLQRGERHGHLSRIRWRRGMGRCGGRSGDRNSLRQRQRRSLDRRAGREHATQNSPKALYLSQCAVCHGEKMAGSPPAIPSLVGVGDRMSAADVAATIRNGKGRMPGFANLETDRTSGTDCSHTS